MRPERRLSSRNGGRRAAALRAYSGGKSGKSQGFGDRVPKYSELMYILDLELCRYHPGPLDADSWSVPLRAVGWLEHPSRFSQGAPPAGLVPRLTSLLGQMVRAFPHYRFRGGKTCSICEALGLTSPGPIWSQENLIIPGSGEVYVAPGGVVHYIEAHCIYHPNPLFARHWRARTATLRSICVPCATPTLVKNHRWRPLSRSPFVHETPECSAVHWVAPAAEVLVRQLRGPHFSTCP